MNLKKLFTFLVIGIFLILPLFAYAQMETEGGVEVKICNKAYDLDILKTLTLHQGTAVASANAMTLGDGNLFDITGTTTINTIATKGVGTVIILEFDGILTLTHSNDLFLPTAANITTAAGDIAVFYEYAAADWRCLSYQRANGGLIGDLNLNTHEITIKDVDLLPISYADDGSTAPDIKEIITSTNKTYVRKFSGSANQDVYVTWAVPFDFSGSTITYCVTNWVTNSTAPANNEIIAYSLTGVSIANSELLSSAQGSAVTSSLTADATYAQYDRLETAYSSAVTVTGIAAGETVIFHLTRLAATTDTYGQKIGAQFLKIKYTRKLTND